MIVWYTWNIHIQSIFSLFFIAFDESPVTHLPRLGPPQKRVNSNVNLPRCRGVREEKPGTLSEEESPGKTTTTFSQAIKGFVLTTYQPYKRTNNFFAARSFWLLSSYQCQK